MATDEPPEEDFPEKSTPENLETLEYISLPLTPEELESTVPEYPDKQSKEQLRQFDQKIESEIDSINTNSYHFKGDGDIEITKEYHYHESSSFYEDAISFFKGVLKKVGGWVH